MKNEFEVTASPQQVNSEIVETGNRKDFQLSCLLSTVPTYPPPIASGLRPATKLCVITSIDEVMTSQNPPLAQQDTGRTAWLVLCGAIIIQGTLYAFPQTFGVFQDFFSKDSKLSNTSQSIWIGVLSTGVPFLGAPFMTVLCKTYPGTKWKYYVVIGWAICVVSLIGSAFCESLIALTLTQGVLYGCGLLIMDVPVLLILNTWFVRRRGAAYGLLFGTTDLTGFGATMLANHLLHNHSLKVVFLSFGCILFTICGPAIWILKARPINDASLASEYNNNDVVHSPVGQCTTPSLFPQSHIRYYYRPIFYIFILANVFHSFAYYLPFIYLPSYTTSLGYSPTHGAWILAGANFAQIFGEIAFGQLSDKFNVHCLVMICSLVSSVAALTLWGFAHSIVQVAFFAFIFGVFGSGLISLWARMGTFFGQNDAQMIFSVMSFGRGVGSIISGPISSALLAATASRGSTMETGSFRYGNGNYLGLVLFVGCSMAISALMGMIGLLVGWSQDELGRVDRRRRRSSRSIKVKNQL